MNYESLIWKILLLDIMLLVNVVTPNEPNENMMRIVKGKVARIEDYPYLIDLRYEQDQVCGGSIISPQWVLTAGHCIVHEMTSDQKKFRVGVGHQTNGKGKLYGVAKMIVHEMYEGQDHDHYADLALVKIKGKFKFGKNVKAIKLNKSPKRRDTDWADDCMAAGWGLDQNDGYIDEQPDNFLRSVKMKVVDPSLCDDEWPYLFRASICAIGTFKGSGTCSGDSGAPLVCNDTQIGILSYGTMDCVPSKSEIYTRVSTFYSWIMDIIKTDENANKPNNPKNKPKQEKTKERKKKKGQVKRNKRKPKRKHEINRRDLFYVPS